MNTENIIKLIKDKKKIYLDSFALEIGIPILETQRILNKFASEYGADIEADENGELIYIFDEIPSLNERLLNFLLLLGKFFIKISLDISSSIIKIMMLLVFFSYSPIYILLNGLSDKKNKKSLHENILSFTFGDNYLIKKINHEENILNFIRKYEKITLSDIINITGLNEDDSQKLILSLLVKYEGDILVSDNGVIYYTFNEFDFRGVKNNKFSYIWQRKLPEYKLNENKDDDNAKIVIFAIINIIISSGFCYGLFDFKLLSEELFYHYFKLWFGETTLFFSIIFLILPLIRYPFNIAKRKVAEKLNYVYYLLNDFSFHTEKDYVNMDETDDEAEEYLFKNYPNIFKHDFINNKDVIELQRFHDEIKFTSNNNPKSIGIIDPDDTDFLDSFKDF